jgi:hypothetical protein
MNKEIIVNEKKFLVRELLNRELKLFPKVLLTDTEEDKKRKEDERIKMEVMLGANLTELEYENLTMKEHLTLRKAILDLNTPDKDFWATN